MDTHWFYLHPKKLSDVCPDTSEAVFAKRAIAQNLELSAHLALVTNAWTSLEMELGKGLANFLHLQPEVALAIYSAVHNIRARQDILKKAARSHLTNEMEQKVFDELITIQHQVYQDRVKLEHGLWGYTSDIPDALLRIHPQDALEHHLAEDKYFTDRKPLIPSPMLGTELIDVFYKEDFVAFIERMEAVELLFLSFRYWRDDHFSLTRPRWHARLCEEPRIRSLLSPTLEAQRSNRQQQRQLPPKDRPPKR
jgi:hypothetical protein